MRNRWMLRMVGVLALGVLAGCVRSTTMSAMEMERVDQELVTGNRGYFLGTPPAPGHRKASREVMEIRIDRSARGPEGSGRRRADATSAGTQQQGGYAYDAEVETATTPQRPRTATATRSGTTYTVQKGDTLWSIARRVYGKGAYWEKIYDANRQQLPEPGRLRAGMLLAMPDDVSTGVYEK